jgi:hypothetical protein
LVIQQLNETKLVVAKRFVSKNFHIGQNNLTASYLCRNDQSFTAHDSIPDRPCMSLLYTQTDPISAFQVAMK